MVEVELVTVRVEMPANTSVVLLRERGGQRRLLPILIGSSEATAIAYALDHVETPRPMTHDLLKNLLDALGVSIEQVIAPFLLSRGRGGATGEAAMSGRRSAFETADELAGLGEELRQVLVERGLRSYLDGI